VPQTDRQTNRRQYDASSRSYCVQQHDRLKRWSTIPAMTICIKETSFYNVCREQWLRILLICAKFVFSYVYFIGKNRVTVGLQVYFWSNVCLLSVNSQNTGLDHIVYGLFIQRLQTFLNVCHDTLFNIFISMTSYTGISVATGRQRGAAASPTGPGLDSEIRANPMRSVNT